MHMYRINMPLAMDCPALSVLQYKQTLEEQTDSLSLVATAVPASPCLLELAALGSDIWLGV